MKLSQETYDWYFNDDDIAALAVGSKNNVSVVHLSKQEMDDDRKASVRHGFGEDCSPTATKQNEG